MANDATLNQYLTNEVMSASPAKLRLLLLDGAARFARQAAAGLRDNNFEKSYEGFTQCRAIVLELMNSVRDEVDPELGQTIRELYAFIYRELVSASADKDAAAAEKIVELLDYERETWALLMEQAAKEEAATTTPGNAEPKPGAGPPSAVTPPSRGSISFQA